MFGFDVGVVNDFLLLLFLVGFYYKIFMWLKFFWDCVYELVIWVVVGFGKLFKVLDYDYYGNIYVYCDVFVVGFGLVGLVVVLVVVEIGVKVILCDE